jgi:hypothetical protein
LGAGASKLICPLGSRGAPANLYDGHWADRAAGKIASAKTRVNFKWITIVIELYIMRRGHRRILIKSISPGWEAT